MCVGRGEQNLVEVSSNRLMLGKFWLFYQQVRRFQRRANFWLCSAASVTLQRRVNFGCVQQQVWRLTVARILAVFISKCGEFRHANFRRRAACENYSVSVSGTSFGCIGGKCDEFRRANFDEDQLVRNLQRELSESFLAAWQQVW